MTQRDDQPESVRDRQPGTGEKPQGELRNVDLQFMGSQGDRVDERLDMEDTPPGEHEARGLDKQDVASIGSMITSDPASTKPGAETSLDTKGE